MHFCQSLVLFFISFALLTGCQQTASTDKKIGIIIPIEHKAMNDIVAGFTETLRKESPYPIQFKIANAQGDLNLQRAIIQQMKDEGDDLIVPIGSVATQMSIAMVQRSPIISLAAMYSDAERKQQKNCQTAVVHDEISPQQLVLFIHETYPKLSHFTLIHSASDKVFPEVDAAVAAGKKLGITIKPVMVPSLNELYSVANSLPKNTQGMIVLKDSLIVSGISTLVLSANRHHIPLISSDQGSVEDGAGFALGVHERDIGYEGAKLAAAVLAGKAACELPIVEMTKLTVFVNKNSLKNTGQSFGDIERAANQLHYAIEVIDNAQN